MDLFSKAAILLGCRKPKTKQPSPQWLDKYRRALLQFDVEARLADTQSAHQCGLTGKIAALVTLALKKETKCGA